MVRLNTFLVATHVFLANCLWGTTAVAQGLILNLPEDRMSVEYEGTLTQGTSVDDQSPLSWNCELTIKSVGREDAEFEGKVQPCRWVEIKTLTGKAGAAGIDPGPVGARLYKILIPESKVIDNWEDSDSIPNDLMPIIKGYRRLGEDAAKPITTPAIRFYPTITLLNNYRNPETIATADTPEVLIQGENITARHMKGTLVMESQKTRSVNEGEYWVSKDVPFGLARWIVTVTNYEKDSAAPVSEFRPVAVRKVDMKLRRKRTDAESELVNQQ
jgi:hypothetical protein